MNDNCETIYKTVLNSSSYKGLFVWLDIGLETQ